jgi:hypothetical protein
MGVGGKPSSSLAGHEFTSLCGVFPFRHGGMTLVQMLVRVSVRFPDGDEVRYLERAPSPNSVIQGRGTKWVVTDVDLDTTGGYLVSVRRKRKFLGGRR